MRRFVYAAVCALLSSTMLVAGSTAAHASDPVRVTQNLHFKVTVGPNHDINCDIVGDLYLPPASTPGPYPAILATNGFGGSKNDFAPSATEPGFGPAWAGQGYAVLAYSGLGFGGSTCKITLDDPAYDGVAGSQIVDFLGGKSGVAFTDSAHTVPGPDMSGVILQDNAATHDPRVGMIGGSYGGQIQFAVASVDPRLDTIVPAITWNNLNYSLAPNNANQGVGPAGNQLVTGGIAGVVKFFWAAGFSAVGVEDGLTGAQADPTRLVPCPNFADWVCPGLAYGAATGTLDPATAAHLQSASVASYVSKVRIPTLLMQGETDTLFNLNEATANFEALQAQHTDVRMIWQQWGHSNQTPAANEWSWNNPQFGTQYQTDRVFNWFAHYLKGQNTDLGPKFAFFRDWISYSGNASQAYQSTGNGNYPFDSTRYYLGSGDLATGASSGTATQTFVTAPGGLPTSISPLDAVTQANASIQEKDAPGTFAAWNTAPLAANTAVVGVPKLTLKVNALSGVLGNLSPLTDLVLFVRLQDVAPDGTATDIRQLTAPVRVDPSQPFTVRLPAIVHQFAAGHQIRLIVAGGSVNYRGGVAGNIVSISGGSAQTLDLPIDRNNPDALSN